MGCVSPDSVEKIITELARNRVEAGLTTAEEVTKAVHEMVKEHLPFITEREIGDIYSNYGQSRQMSQEPVAVAFRDVKAQQQLLNAIEDAMAGERPLKSGMQRDKPSDRQRALRRKLVDTLREQGIKIESTASYDDMMKSLLDAKKTGLRNSIRDLDYQIATGEKSPAKRKLPLVYDSETMALMAERDILRRQAEDPTAKNKANLQDRLATVEKRLREGDISRREQPYPPEIYDDAEAAALREKLKDANDQLRRAQNVPRQREQLQNQITDLERRIREHDFSRAAKPDTGPVDPEVAKLRAQRDDLQATLREMEGPRQMSNEQRLGIYKKHLDRREKQLRKDLATLKSGKKPEKKPERPDLVLDDEARVQKRNLAVLQRQVHQEFNELEWKNKSRTAKGFAYAAAGARGFVLSGTQVLGKIGGALLHKVLITPFEEAAGGAWARVPIKGFAETAAKAPRHGSGLSLAAEKAAGKGALAGIKAIPQILKTGESDLDLGQLERAEHPQIPGKIGTVLAVPGRVHAAEKGILKSAEYQRSMTQRQERARRLGLNPDDPEVKAENERGAYKDAEEVVLLGDNAFSRGIARWERGFSDETQSVLKIIAPVRKVPPNYLKQMISEYMFGIFRGTWRALRARNPELLEKMTEDEADLTMRLLKRGTVGLMYMVAAGLTGTALLKKFGEFGGYYVRGEKRKEGDLKPGEMKIGGHKIPHWLAHAPPIEAAQVIATFEREIAREEARAAEKGDKARVGRALGSAALASARGVAEQTPFLRELSNAFDAMQGPDKASKVAGEFVAGRVEPQIMRELARATDREGGAPFWQIWKDPVARVPKGFEDEFLMGIPGERQKVEAKELPFSDRVKKELGARGMTIPKLKQKAGESDQAYKDRSMADIQALNAALPILMESDYYQGLDDKGKHEALKSARQHVRAKERGETTEEEGERRLAGAVDHAKVADILEGGTRKTQRRLRTTERQLERGFRPRRQLSMEQ